MRPLNLVFMGTPQFALPTLAALADSGHRILAVYTAPPRPAGRGQKLMNTPVHDYALLRQLTVRTPATLKDSAAQAEFAALEADVAVVAAYGLLLPKAVLTAPRMGCINVHPSLLPRWRGAAPVQRALMAGDTETGVVIMQMDEGLDTGGMLLVKRCPIPEGATGGEMENTLAHLAAPMVIEALAGLGEGTLSAVPQGGEGVTYAKKITKDDTRIDWKKPASEIRNQIRGLNPSPCAAFSYNNEIIKVLKASVQESSGDEKPGSVMQGEGLILRCGEDALRAEMVQRPGKKPMADIEMLRGFRVPHDSVLE